MGSGTFNRGGTYAAFQYNTIDNFNYPQHGADAAVIWQANYRELGSDIDGSSLVVSGTKVMTWGDHTLIPSFVVQTSLEGDDLMQDSFGLGGLLNLSGYTQDELSGQHTAMGYIAYLRKISRRGLGDLKMQLFFGGSIEAGNVWDRREDMSLSSLMLAGSVFVGADSFIGPAYIGYGQAEGGHRMFYFTIGQKF